MVCENVCVSKGSVPVDPDSVTQSFRRAASRAGLEGFRFHDLRHTHASLLMSQNVHPKVVSERLGHSDVVITLNLYSHVLPNVQEEAAERFGEAWRERSPDGGNVRLGAVPPFRLLFCRSVFPIVKGPPCTSVRPGGPFSYLGSFFAGLSEPR